MEEEKEGERRERGKEGSGKTAGRRRERGRRERGKEGSGETAGRREERGKEGSGKTAARREEGGRREGDWGEQEKSAPSGERWGGFVNCGGIRGDYLRSTFLPFLMTMPL